MRPVVKDPVDLWSPIREGLSRLGKLSPATLRLAFGLAVAAAGVLLIDLWINGANLSQLVALGATLALAHTLVDGLVPRRGAQVAAAPSPRRAAEGARSGETPAEDALACPAGQAACWIVDAMQGLLTAAKDVPPRLGISQAANSLARKACELVDANAAWIYQIEENGERIALISSHLRSATAGNWENLTEGALRLAEESAHSLSRPDFRGRRTPRVSAVGDYMYVPLVRRRRALGVLIVHSTETEGSSSPLKGEFLSILASQATLSLENILLHETQQDIQAKLRQFELHRTDYVATLSHELRTPLTSIKGFAQLLMREHGVSAEMAREYASTIAAEADKLALIVNDIVDLTRMETGLLEIHREPVALGRLIRGVVKRLQPMAPSQQMQTLLPERLPSVRVDPERLDQVLGRLLADAMRQSSPGTPILLAAEAGEEGVAIRLEYRTTESRIESLTEALKGLGQYSSDGQATQLGRGRLGLYICRNFIEAHGGKMWIECPDEQVARVVFTLPY